jgi:alpha-tubulin suppressor-like RCC1 family protein
MTKKFLQHKDKERKGKPSPQKQECGCPSLLNKIKIKYLTAHLFASFFFIFTILLCSKLEAQKTFDGGLHFSIILCNDNTVWTCGINEYGQLGNNSTQNSSTLVQIVGLSDIVQIAAGEFHSIALKSDGTVWTWGKNDCGQLGNGTYQYDSVPNQVLGLPPIIFICSGQRHCLALDENCNIWAWGNNDSGQLGDHTTTTSNIPIQMVNTGYDIMSIAAGEHHSMMLLTDGTVWIWGIPVNNMGQAGPNPSFDPVLINGINNIIYITAGEHYSVALKNDGTVWSWGEGVYGTMGNGTNNYQNPNPVMASINNVKKVEVAMSTSYALKTDSTVWAWGKGDKGEIGNGINQSINLPDMVNGIFDAYDIDGGQLHAFTLVSDSSIYSWGWNYAGELGDGTTYLRTSPVQMITPCPVVLPDKFNSCIVNMTEDIIEINEINIYPNPTTGIFSIPSNIFNKVEIFNSYGQKIIVTDKDYIDISSYQSGIYLIVIQTKESTHSVKFVKQ